MVRTPDAGVVVMRGEPHWRRCGFDRTTMIDGVVMLGREPRDDEEAHAMHDAAAFAGLAFDRHCRLFHPLPQEKRIEFLLWGRQTGLAVHDDPPHPFEMSSSASQTTGTPSLLPQHPRALACDDADYLYVADDGNAPALWLIDIWQHEVALRVSLEARPLDVCCAAGKAYALLDASNGAAQRWLTLGPCDPPRMLPWPAGVANASRLDVVAEESATPRGFVLVDAGTATSRVVCLHDPAIAQSVPFCSDFVVMPKDPEFGWPFMFARGAGDDFVLRKLAGREFGAPEYWRAPNYDECGIACAPDGRIAYWTARGLRHASLARNHHELRGIVYGFALDSNREQNEWGRVMVEACVPDGTTLSMRCVTRDDLEYGDAIARAAPAGVAEATPPFKRPELTPLPSAAALPQPALAQPLYRDPHHPALEPPPADAFATYEAPVVASPGRFLWVVLDVAGTRSRTPRVRSLRVEFPGHDLLRQLPKTLWRDPHAREFLRRYLTPLAAEMTEWGNVASLRHRLLDPRVAPAEALDWLGSFVGLAMDPCWPERARRDMLRNAVRLFRIRGTKTGLCEMIRILTASQVVIVEKFRLRSGGVAGNPEARRSRSVLGSGFRVGGNIGATTPSAPSASTERGFDDYAHRFTVMVVAHLSDERMRCVRRLIETHKPAHTMFDLCSVATGTRVGVGLHVGLASAIGRNSGFDPLTVGDSVLGKGYVIGRPELKGVPA